MAWSDLPQMQIGYTDALGLQPVSMTVQDLCPHLRRAARRRTRGSIRTGPIGDDQAADDPEDGSAQTQFGYIATTKAAMARTDVAASAMTCDIGRTKAKVMVGRAVGVRWF